MMIKFGNFEKKIAPKNLVMGFGAPENAKMGFSVVFLGHA